MSPRRFECLSGMLTGRNLNIAGNTAVGHFPPTPTSPGHFPPTSPITRSHLHTDDSHI